MILVSYEGVGTLILTTKKSVWRELVCIFTLSSCIHSLGHACNSFVHIILFYKKKHGDENDDDDDKV